MIRGDIKRWANKEHLQVQNSLLMLCKNLDSLILMRFKLLSLHQEMYISSIYLIWNLISQTYATSLIFICVTANF